MIDDQALLPFDGDGRLIRRQSEEAEKRLEAARDKG
jgi:hypothetical protein